MAAKKTPAETPQKVTQETPQETPAQVPAAVQPEAIDPWEDMVDVTLERAPRGETPYVFISLNNRNYQIPKGKTSPVPRPVFERLEILQAAIVAEDELYKDLHAKTLDIRDADD